MRFTVLHKRHHKVSQTVPFFMHCKTVTILLTIRVRRHFVMSITKNHEPHYVTVLDNPRIDGRVLRRLPLRSLLLYKVHPPFSSFFRLWPIVTKRWKRERYCWCVAATAYNTPRGHFSSKFFSSNTATTVK